MSLLDVRFPQLIHPLHTASALARNSEPAYSCRMARSDCPICEGSGWKVVERTTLGAQPLAAAQGAQASVAAGEPRTVWAVPCDCTARRIAASARLSRARIPERYRHCDFENFETDIDIEQVPREQLETWNRSLAPCQAYRAAFRRGIHARGRARACC